MNTQIETEAQNVEALRAELDAKQEQAENVLQNVTLELQQKLVGRSADELKPILRMDEPKFQEYLTSQARKLEDSRINNVSRLEEQRNRIFSQLNVKQFIFNTYKIFLSA